MKIINPDDFYITNITADSTLYTADSTELTADVTSITTNNLFLKIIPREYPTNVLLTFYNELTTVSFEEECVVENKDGYMTIPFTFTDFVEGDSFEVTVKNLDGKIIHKNKVFITEVTDLQNFKTIRPDNDEKIRF